MTRNERKIIVNTRALTIPADARVGDIKRIARAAGIEPALRGRGGVLELRGYVGSGAKLLDHDSAVPRCRHTASGYFEEFGFRDAEPATDNSLGSGRERYWPARSGHRNVRQVRAAVYAAHPGNRRIWPMQLCLRAPSILHAIGAFPRDDWDPNPNPESCIVRNARTAQFDDEFALPEAQARTLVEKMCWYASIRRDRSEGRIERFPLESDEPGALELNRAQAQDIAKRVRGVGDKRARAIVAERDLRGPYESHPDIAKRVRGVGPRTVSAIIEAGYRM